MADPVEKPKQAAEEVVINGVKYIVTPELAKSLKEENANRQKEIEALKAPKPEPKKDNVTKIGDRIFEDPDAVLDEYGKKIREDVKKEVFSEYEKVKAREEADKNAQKALNDFYTSFFNENKELSKDRKLVELIFEKNYSQWNSEAQGDLEKLKKMLAKESTDTILAHIKPNETPKPAMVFETGGTMDTPEPAPQEEKPGSLTAVLKSRAEARRKHT